MLSIVVYLLIALAVITAVGHGIWLLLAAIFRTVSSERSSPKPTKPVKRPDLHEDLAAMRRLIAYFKGRGWIDETEAQRLRELSDRGEQTPFSVPTPTVSKPVHPLDDDPITPPIPQQLPLPAPQLRNATSSISIPPTTTNLPTLNPPTTNSTTTRLPTPNTATTPAASAPARALSEMLQSFLVAHNIRWGELTAGILIVVCSIGLVISLWNTLTQVNRLIPAAIFLFAVAGIEAAGLYTLNRWKLRHTSRAVLIIATMLIPLSMMAGVSIAGRGEGAVSLQSWTTWIAIIVSWGISGCMIYFSGRALIGKHRWPYWLLGLGIPTFMLPLVPAAVRFGQVHATWLLVAASLTVLGFLLRSSHRIMAFSGRRLLPANSQYLYLFAGLTTYNILLLAAMLLVRFEVSLRAVILLTIAITPSLFGLLALATSVRTTVLRSGKRILATSLFLIVSAIIVIPFPLVVADTTWLGLWGLAVSGSALCVAIATRQRSTIAWLSLAAALVIPPLATVYFGDIPSPESIGIIQRYISGYGSVSLIIVGLASLAVSILSIRGPRENQSQERPFWAASYNTLFFQDRISQFAIAILFTGVASIAIVGLGPDRWLAGMPRSITTATLFITAATITVLMRRALLTPMLVSIPLSIGWATVFFASDNWWESGFEFFSVAVCQVLAATTVTLIVIAESLYWSTKETRTVTARRISTRWWRTIGVGALALMITSLFCISKQPSIAAVASLVAAVSLHLVVFRGLLPKWAATATLLAWAALLLCTHAAIPTLFRFEEISFTVNSILIAMTALGAVVLAWQVLRIFQLRNQRMYRWFIAVGKDRAQADSVLSTILIWSYVTVALLQLTSLTLLHAVDRTDAIFVSRNILLGFTACGLVLLFVKRILVFNNLPGQRRSNLLTESRDDFWLTATMFAFAAPLSLIGITEFQQQSVQLLTTSWLTVALISGFVATFWWLDRANKSTRPDSLFPRNAILVLNLVGFLIVGGICLAVPANPQWQSLDQLSGFHWLHASLVALPVIFVAQMIVAANFCKSRTLTIAHQVIAIATGPYIAHILIADASFPIYILAAIWSSLIAYLSTLAFARISKGSIACQFGLALLTISLATWTVLALANVSPQVYRSWGSTEYWMIAYLLGAAIFVIKFGQEWIASTSLRVVNAVSCGAGLTAIWLLQLDLLPSVSLSQLTGTHLVGAIWLVTAAYAASEGFMYRRKWHTAYATGLMIAVNALCVTMAARGLQGEWLWGLAALGLNLIGLFWYALLHRHVAGQVLAVAGTASMMLLVISLRIREPSVLAMMTLIAAAVAVIWSLYDFFSRTEKVSNVRAAGIISWLSGTVLLLGAFATLQLFAMKQASYTMGSTASVVTVGIAVGCCLGCYLLAPNRLNSTPIAFLSSQLLAGLIVTGTTQNFQNMDRLAFIVTACTCVAGLWGWSWPIARGYLFANPESLRQQHRVNLCICGAALLTLVAASLTVWMNDAELARSLSVASVLGFAGIVGISFGWWRLAGEQARWGVKSLPTFAVLLFASGLGLAAVGLVSDEDPTGLVTIMRLFIASVVLTPTMLWIGRFAFALRGEEWEIALRRGAYLGIVLAVCSLASMFGGELIYRGDARLAELPTSLILGVAVLLSLSCAFCAACAIFPESVKATTGELSERQRTIIIFAAQVLGGLTWIHLVLCRPQFAFVGLRPYWPFTVMLLAFLSAGITQFARRRKDAVLERAMKKSTFLLPLIPVIGFWIARHETSWMFLGERSSYSLLLFVGAVFYGSLALLWPQHRFPKVVGIILGNGALWVLLAQMPSLSFLSHPQIWLIPPAVCVLLATFLEQKSVPSGILSPIRYGALFVIYISSTADILLYEAGASFWRPIVLILLALFGMAVGIVARTRAFLYLGTLFVFIGVLSMVWQAGRAIDQSWPWWVFGISMGIIMLVGLTFLEKNRATLKRFASELSGWQP